MPNPNELSGGDLTNDILAKRFEIQPNPAPYMASELFPVVVLENDRPEYHFLGQSRLCWAFTEDAAAAGNHSQVVINNPAGTNALAVVSRIDLINPGGTIRNIDIRIQGVGTIVAPDTPAAGFFRDSRYGFAAGFRTTCITGPLTSATQTGDKVWERRVPVTSTVAIKIPIILGPGSGVVVSMVDQNAGIAACFQWRERAAQRTELQGAQ